MLYVLKMPKDPSLACWALFFLFFFASIDYKCDLLGVGKSYSPVFRAALFNRLFSFSLSSPLSLSLTLSLPLPLLSRPFLPLPPSLRRQILRSRSLFHFGGYFGADSHVPPRRARPEEGVSPMHSHSRIVSSKSRRRDVLDRDDDEQPQCRLTPIVVAIVFGVVCYSLPRC